MNRRKLIKAGLAGLPLFGAPALAGAGKQASDRETPILVVVELSGGNDGLNTVVPYGDDAYYRHRPTLGIRPDNLLRLDDHYGLNPGMLGLHRLWQDNQLAIVHGCGYDNPSFSHFTSMAYWHTGAPHQGSRYGWVGRLADTMSDLRRDEMIINVSAGQSLAVNSRTHTPLVFKDPQRFTRHNWMGAALPQNAAAPASNNASLEFLREVNRSATAASERIGQAWQSYRTDVDYGLLPMDLPKVAACIHAGLPTPLYYVAFENNAFDTHVNQPALHRRLLSYACDGIHGFIKDMERIGQAHRVVVMVFSEFGRRVPENANRGTDHGTANLMYLAGAPVNGGHYGEPPSLTDLVSGDNLKHTVDFRRVYATVIESWLGVDASAVLGGKFEPFAASLTG